MMLPLLCSMCFQFVESFAARRCSGFEAVGGEAVGRGDYVVLFLPDVWGEFDEYVGVGNWSWEVGSAAVLVGEG